MVGSTSLQERHVWHLIKLALIIIKGIVFQNSAEYQGFTVFKISPVKMRKGFSLMQSKPPQANQHYIVMCTVNDSHKVVFEIDTGASCNILPFVDTSKPLEINKGST